MRPWIERERVGAGDGQIQFTERRCLVEHEGDGIGIDGHMARHARDLGVRGHVVGDDRVVLNLVTAVGTEPVGR